MHHCSIDDQLHGHGLRKTHPRHRIIELFAQPRAWSARALQQQLHDVGQATIYRTLRLLKAEGIITAVHSHDDEESFERAKQAHHDHALCTNCRAVECLPCPIPSLTEHVLEFQRICKSCTT